MAQVHFVVALTEDGKRALVRADALHIVEPIAGGFRYHTASGSIDAVGATFDTVTTDLRSADINVVALNASIPEMPPAPAVSAPQVDPPRAPVVRAPPPVRVPELEAQQAANAEAEETEHPVAAEGVGAHSKRAKKTA